MTGRRFSIARFVAMMLKEFVQMRRDRLTFAMMVGIPIMQLILFGFAINADPKSLPTAVLSTDSSVFTRSLAAAVENTGYFHVTHLARSEQEANDLLQQGIVQFVIQVPANFSHDLMRGDQPTLLVQADASDPVATGNALAAIAQLASTGVQHDLTGPLTALAPQSGPFQITVHRRYNPEGITQYNIVPGLVGTILTLTMVIMTGLAVTRERERGTMETLLAMPIRPLEVMLGKIFPFIGVGAIQVTIIFVFARLLFHVPIEGSWLALAIALLIFIATNLAVGFLFSTVAKNQLQAMQMAIFFFLPSILLSGFMFPFRGMPHWAQVIGEVLPLTHFLRIIRGVLLKGYGIADSWPHLWPLLLFLLVVATLAVNRYRQTLD
jgi:ABC-2 type transport system permease protein